MRKANNAASLVTRRRLAPTAKPVTYEQLAGGLAAEMAQSVSTGERSEFCAPFELVIVDSRGAVVFAGQVGGDGSVRQHGAACVVRRSHFPATALLTDGQQVTRTFQIERAN